MKHTTRRRSKRCPWTRNSVRLAQNTALFQLQPTGHFRGPNEPILGPADTVLGPHGSKHGQKATPTIPKLILSINFDNATLWGAPRRHWDPFLVILGPLGAPPGACPKCGHSGARSTSAAETQVFRGPMLTVCCPNTILDNVGTLFSHFGTPLAVGPAWGPVGLVACCCLLLAACL